MKTEWATFTCLANNNYRLIAHIVNRDVSRTNFIYVFEIFNTYLGKES